MCTQQVCQVVLKLTQLSQWKGEAPNIKQETFPLPYNFQAEFTERELCVISLAASKLTSFPVNPFERKSRPQFFKPERDPFSFSLIPRGNAAKAKPVIFRPKEHA